MLAPSGDLLRAGLGLKMNQLKLATRSYLRDRTDHATGTVASYAAAAGLYAAAGIFLIAACMVGAAALFRWVEIKYGLFYAFGAVGGLLVVIAAICASLAAAKLNRKSPEFPSLTSRLRVAIKANPIRSGQIGAVRNNAAAVKPPVAKVAPAGDAKMAAGIGRKYPGRQYQGIGAEFKNPKLQAGLALTAALLGWAVTRRRQQARPTEK